MAERFVVADDVAWIESPVEGPDAEPQVIASRVPDGPPVVLQGPSALIWLGAVDHGDGAAVVRRVAEQTGETEQTVRAGVTDFLGQLVGRGLLARAEPQSSSSDSR